MATSTAPQTARRSLPPRVSPAELQVRLQADPGGIRLLDVRTAGEYLTCRIPSALNVPLDQLPRYREEVSGCPDPVVLVCQLGSRAEQAQRLLAEAGHPQTHVLDGGMVAWQQAAGEVEHGEPRWALERQVRLVAGSIVLTGILGSVKVPQLKWLSGAIGAGLTFAALSNTCMMGTMLSKLPYNRGSRRDVERAVSALAA